MSFLTSYLPSIVSALIAVLSIFSTDIQALIHGCTEQVTGNQISSRGKVLNFFSACGGCDSFQATLTCASAWTL